MGLPSRGRGAPLVPHATRCRKCDARSKDKSPPKQQHGRKLGQNYNVIVAVHSDRAVLEHPVGNCMHY